MLNHVTLTDREVVTIRHVANGHIAAAVARLMGVGLATVETNIQSARYKMGAANRSHLIALAFAYDILKKGDIE